MSSKIQPMVIRYTWSPYKYSPLRYSWVHKVYGCVYYTIFDNLSVNWAIHNGLRKVLVDCHGPLTRKCILSRYRLDMQKDVMADFGHVVSTPHVYCHFLPD